MVKICFVSQKGIKCFYYTEQNKYALCIKKLKEKALLSKFLKTKELNLNSKYEKSHYYNETETSK